MQPSRLAWVLVVLAVSGLAPRPAGAAEGDLLWARHFGGTNTDRGSGVAVDGSGNAYGIGSFRGTADFDPSDGVSNLTSAGDNDVFVAKLDPAGGLVWARQLGGTRYDLGYGVGVDGNGNAFVTGVFSGTADLDPSADTWNLTSSGGGDVFVVKLGRGGNLRWARQLGGTGFDGGKAIAVNGFGNTYAAGYFRGTADFDPSAGVSNLVSSGGRDVFVVKLGRGGNLRWAGRFGGPGFDEGLGLAVDSTNVYVAGYFSGNADFDPSADGVMELASAGGDDVFVAKLDPDGSLVWARRFGGGGSDRGHGVAVDGLGNVYVTGRFSGTAEFDPLAGVSNLVSAGGSDVFLAKLDSAGALVWARQFGGTGADEGLGVAAGPGGAHVTGYFSGTADFDPSVATLDLTSAGGGDVFAAYLDAAGNLRWAGRFGGRGDDMGDGIAVGSPSAYVTGQFSGTADFDPAVATLDLTSNGIEDAFLLKMDAPISDGDDDGVADEIDNCPGVKNARQNDRDRDGIGNVCDTDFDGDGVVNGADAMPWNPAEWDDTDGDRVGDNTDNCVTVRNGKQADFDGDGVGNACDPDPGW